MFYRFRWSGYPSPFPFPNLAATIASDGNHALAFAHGSEFLQKGARRKAKAPPRNFLQPHELFPRSNLLLTPTASTANSSKQNCPTNTREKTRHRHGDGTGSRRKANKEPAKKKTRGTVERIERAAKLVAVDLLGQEGEQIVGVHSLLLGGIPVPNRNRAVPLQRLEVHGHAERSPGLVHSPVPSPCRATS